MKTSLKKIEQNRYELTVDLDKEDLVGYIRKAEDRLASEIKIDGFRPGKAPRERIRKEVGEKQILEQALDIALQQSLSEAINKEKAEVIRVSDLNIKENSAARLLYTVMLVVFPVVKLPDIGKIKVKQKEVVVDKADLDNAFEFILSSRAKFIDKDESVEKGDRVEVDFEVTSQGLPVEGGISKNHPLVVGDNKFIPGFEEQLVGMKKGEDKKFSLKAPVDYFHKSVAGKDLDFSVKMVRVQRVEKPVLNDEFVKGLGRFESIKELEENISEGILEEKKGKEKQRLRLEILSKIFEESKIELPEDLVKEKLDGMIAGFDQDLHQKGMELSFYLAHLNKTEDDLRKDWRPEAEKQTAFALILRKIGKDKNLQPLPEEVEEEANRIVQMMIVRGETEKGNIDMERLKEAVAGDLTNEKVFSYLEKQCLV